MELRWTGNDTYDGLVLVTGATNCNDIHSFMARFRFGTRGQPVDRNGHRDLLRGGHVSPRPTGLA